MEDENTSQSSKQKNSGNENSSTETQNNEEANVDEDKFNPTLAAMENEIKPKVLKTIQTH